MEDAATADYSGLDIVLFSAGGATSKALAEKVAAAGRRGDRQLLRLADDPEVPLVVSEVNPHAIANRPRASSPTRTAPRWPRCPCCGRCTRRRVSTALIVATYQAVSGSGLAGVAELHGQARRWSADADQLTHDGAAVDFPEPGGVQAPDRLQRAAARRLDRRRRFSSRPTRSRSSATSPARSWRSRS